MTAALRASSLVLLASLAGCDQDRDVTVYAILQCPQRCVDINPHGHKRMRYQLALGKETFTAVIERQDVVRTTFAVTESLTEQGWKCAVAGGRNWSCEKKRQDVMLGEMYTMKDGDLNYTDPDSIDEMETKGWMTFTSWCHHKQIEWHNMSDTDDPLDNHTSGNRSTAAMLLVAGIYYLTGCML